MGTKLVCFVFVQHLKYLKRLSVCASARTLPRPFPLADLLRRRLAPPYPCSLGAILTIFTCLLAQGWPSTTIMSIPNERSCCWAPQGQPPPDLRRPVLRGAASVAGARALAGRARRGLCLRLRSRAFSASTLDERDRRYKIDGPFASMCACDRFVVFVCGSRSVRELVCLWSPCLVGGDTLQSSSVIITMKAVIYNTLRHGGRSPSALGCRSHKGALRNAFRKLQRQGRAGDCAYMHDKG